MDTRLRPPAPALAGLIQSLLVTTLPAGPYAKPASIHAIFLLVLRGSIRLDLPDGPVPMPTLCLCGGTGTPRFAAAAPGTRVLMAAVRPGGLRCLLGMPNDTVCEGLFALEELVPRAEVAALAESLAAAPDEDAQLAQFENFLVRRSRSIAAPGPDLALPADWHARPMAALAEQHGIGVRQFERRFLASFGQPWRKVRQQLRCSSLITRLLDTPALAGARHSLDWAGLAAEAGYADQAHLSRDMRHFTGYSPGEWQRRCAERDPALWPYLFSRRQIVDFFGGTGF